MNSDISVGTIIRTICLALALINQLLSAAGKPVLPIEDSTVETLVTSICTVAASVWAYWKNNSWTKEAIEADETLEMLRENKK